MSGPKGLGYQVSAAEQRRRAIEAGRTRIEARKRELASLSEAVEARAPERSAMERLAAEGSLVAAPQDLDECLRVERYLDRLLADGAKLQAAALRRQQQRVTNDALRGISTEVGHLVTYQPASPRPSDAPARWKSRLQKLTALIDDHPEAGGSVVDALAAVREAAVQGDVEAISLALTVAETDTLAAIARAKASVRLIDARDRVRRDNADLQGRAADGLLASLGVATTAAEISRIDQGLAEVRRAVAAQDDRRFVFEAALASLSALGYRVDPEVDPEGVVIVRSDRHPQHGLRVAVNGERATLFTNLVTFAAEGDLPTEREAAEFAAVEQETCADIDRAREDMQRRGVTTSVLYRRTPGLIPVTRVHSGGPGLKRGRSLKERTLD